MSILNCHTRLTVINCTGLPASFVILPEEGHMRLQPIDDAHVQATTATSANSVSEWFQEWIQLMSYGPTYSRLEWSIPPSATETIRLQTEHMLNLQLNWTDASVSWAKHVRGHWSVDIRQAVEVTLYIRADVGEYIKHRPARGPASVKAVELKPYIELACDDELPFVLKKKPVANMFWNAQINLQQIVNPQCD